MNGNHNASIRRLQQELQDINKDTERTFEVVPLEDNLFEWHFSIQGAPDSPYEGGIYHGKIIFPTDYPFKPPDIVILTNNGRFEVGKKICLSATGYHPEQWKPSWSAKTLLIALSSFMVTEGEGAVGSVDMPSAKRKELASKSRGYSCSTCGLSHEALAKRWDKPTDKKRSQDNEKDEMTESPALKDETHTEESSTTSLATEPETLEQPLLASAPAAPAATTEKLSPIEILRRRRVSRMKQKEAQTKSVVKGDDDDDDEKDREDEKDEITEPENQEQHHPAATTTPIEEHNAERTEEQNNAQPDEGELVLAPEETIRNLILDKTVILILFAIVLLALRKWVLFQ